MIKTTKENKLNICEIILKKKLSRIFIYYYVKEDKNIFFLLVTIFLTRYYQYNSKHVIKHQCSKYSKPHFSYCKLN